MFALDTQGNVVKWNRRLGDVTGYSPEELLNKPALAFVPPEEQARTAAAIQRAFMEGYAELEGHLLTKEHHLIPYHWAGALLKNRHGEPVGITGIGRDASEKKRAEEALCASEERWQLAVRGSNDGIWDWNIQSGEVFFSARWKAMRGFEDHEITNHVDEWRSRIHSDDLDRVFQSLDAYLAKQAPEFCEEYRFKRKDGSYIWILDRGVALWADDGTALRMVGSESDITESKQAEEALLESEQRLGAILGNSPSMVFLKDLDGRYLYANKVFSDQLHLDPQGLVGKTDADLFEPDQARRFRWHDQQVVQSGMACTFEEMALHADGPHTGIAVKFPLKDSAGRVYATGGVVTDISERKRAEISLQESEMRYRTLVDLSPDGVLVYCDGKKVYINQSGCKIMGATSPAQLLEDSTFHFSHPDYYDAIHASIKQILETGEPVRRAERTYCRLDGTAISVEVDAGRIMWNGEPAIQIIFADITERKQAVEALRESEAFTVSVLNSLSSQIVVLNSQGVIMAVNKPWLRFAEENEASHLVENFVGMNYLNVCAQAPLFAHGEEAASAQAGILAVLAGTQNEFSLEYPCHSPDQQRWFRMRVTPLLDSQAGVVVAHENITERKLAEKGLHSSEERFDLAVRGSNTGIWDWDLRTGKTYFSPFWKSMLGHKEDELQGEFFEWEERLHPDDRERSLATVRAYLEGTTPQYELEHRLRHKDGSYRWILARGVSLSDAKGKPYRMAGSHIDITKQRQTQEALVQSEHQLRTVLDALPVGVWFTDRAGKTLLANPAAKQIWSNIKQIGLQTENHQAGWWETIGPANEPHRWALSHVLATGVPSLNETFDFECLDGTKKILRNSTIPVKSESGNIMGAVVLNEDITLLRVAQAALELTKFSVDCAVEGFFWIGPDARIVNVNKAACRMLEYTREELTAMTVYDIDPNVPPEVWLTHWEELKEKGSLIFESKYWSRTGRVLNTAVTVNYLRYEGREYGCAIMRDIEPRKRADVALRASEERYRALYDDTPTMYFTLAMDGTVRSVNRFGAKQLGYRVEELIGHSVLGLFHEQDKEAVAASLAECLATPAITRYWEFRKVRKDGSIIWVRETARVCQSSTGETVVLVTCEDINERKRAEDESRERILQASAMQTALLKLAYLDDTSLTFSSILPQVTSIVADMLAVERVSLWLLSEDQTELVCQDLYLRGQVTHSAGSRLTASSYPRYLAVLKESLVIAASNARVDQRTSEFTDDYFSSLGITSVLDVPIRRQGKLIGVLWCEHVGALREWAHEAQDFAASVGQTIVRMIEAAERKRAEMSLRQSEERYRSLLDNAPIGIFVNKAGRFAYANREIQRILNATRAEQLLGMPVLDRIAPEFHTVVKDRTHQLVKKGQPAPSLDEQYVRLDGSRIDVAVTAIPTSFDGTDVIQVLVLDIAERKQAEQEQNRLIEDLIRSRQHFQALFNWTPSAVGISTVAEGRFIDVNEGFSRLTGYMREEVMGRTTLELGLWVDVSERKSVLREIREQGYLHNREGLLRTKSGEIRSLMVSVESIQFGSTPCLIYLCHDITERKRMEDALRMRERELQAALQERERISQDLHDGILQSLFAVGLNLEVAKSFMPPRTRKTSGASLDKAIDQLNRVLREIRNFIARLDLDLFEGKDLPTALQCALKSLGENQATRVRLAVEDRAAKAISVEQSLHLFYVIQEAVSNCIRHGGAQEARVSLKMLKQGVRLSIRDNGRGFNPNVVKGVGHGLANMAARAKRIGGRLTVLSKENEGTRIVLDLPKEASNVSP